MRNLLKMLFIATAGIFMACNQSNDDMAIIEQYDSTPIRETVYQYNDINTQSSGKLTLKSDNSFYLVLNTKKEDNSYDYITAKGTYNNINSSVVLYLTDLYKNHVPQENIPSSINAPYNANVLSLNYPYDQTNGAKIFYRLN